MRKAKLAVLVFIFKLMPSDMMDPNRGNQNNSNHNEEYFAVFNVSVEVEVINSSFRDVNGSNTVYETVVVRVASSIDVYFTPCLITLGISGNTLAVYVFFSSKLRYQSTSQYLSALAISDTLFLGELFPPWMSTINVNGIFHRGAYCKGFVYVSYVTCCLSSWLVIAFTVERFIAIQYPLRRPAVCTVRRARYVIVALTLGSMVVNIPVIHFASSDNQACHIDREKLEQAARFNWVDTMVTFTIPLALIVFFNTWIAAAVCKLERDRVKLTQEERKARRSDFVYLRSQRRITNMLLIVSTMFVLFNCPAYTLRVCGYAYDMDSSEPDDKWLTAQNIATMMFNANFGINFFLYCLTGQNFRRALVQCVPCFGWLARRVRRLCAREDPAGAAARAPSLTASAASTGTEATCTDMSFARPSTRRAPRRPYIRRWTFNNRLHRAIAATAASESIMMRDMAPQPGPSIRPDVTDDLSLPGPSRSSDVRTRAVIEPRRFSADRRSPALEPERGPVEPRGPAAHESGSAIGARRHFAESRFSVVDLRENANERRLSAFAVTPLSAEERRRHRLLHVGQRRSWM